MPTGCRWIRRAIRTEVGAAGIAAYHETDEDWPVIDGYGALVAAWAADVPVTLNAPVQRVTMTRDGVDVETPLGTIAGRTALITVSTNMLVCGRIAFEPELPSWKTTARAGTSPRSPQQDRDRADQRIRGPPRIAVPDRDDARARCPRRPEREALRLRPCRGQHGGAIRGLARAVRSGRVGRVPGGAPQGCLRQQHHELPHTDRVIATTWQGDPWALGAYSAARPGQAHQRAFLARPVEDRLFFAGEATSREFFCTGHGAYLTGQRAIGEIVALLRGPGTIG